MIKIRYGRTVNLGNYETARFEIEVEVDLPEQFATAYVMGIVEGWIERFKTDRFYFQKVLEEMKKQ